MSQTEISPVSIKKHSGRTKLHVGYVATYFLIFIAFLSWKPNFLPVDIGEDLFQVPRNPPIFNETLKLKYSNTPMSTLRPQNQFSSGGLWTTIGRMGSTEPAVLTVITVTKNARDIMRYTARFVLEQSLLPIRWLIVNDHTDQDISYRLLREIVAMDRRFTLVNSTLEPGFSNGRTSALRELMKSPTKYFAFLDDDDFFEYTAYEKCVWLLESNVNASMCGTYVTGFGERNYTWRYGFHDGYKVVVRNPLTGSEILRTSVLNHGCNFDQLLQTGMEDWDFYLCLASRGVWGVTVPEFLFWYRINPDSLRKTRWGSLFESFEDTAKEIRDRYKKLDYNFPRIFVESSTGFETINLSLPFANRLNLKKSILMIIPWMSDGNADSASLRIVQGLSAKGWRVTIVCTLLNLQGNSTTTLHLFQQYTHDIFTIPAIIRLADAPRFLGYLIESRNFQTVLVSNSQLGYGLLPWMSTRYPNVVFTDYVHCEEPDWKNGGYAKFSAIHQPSLDATIASSDRVRQFLIRQGHRPSKIEVGSLGIDLSKVHPLQDETQTAARFKVGIPDKAIVIVFFARTVAFRRAKVATAAFLSVAKDIGEKGGVAIGRKLRMVVIGDGPAMEEAKRISANLGDVVTFVGKLRHAEALKYIQLSDIFCLPSPSKKIAFVLTESRNIGLAALTSTIGGYPEMLVRNASDEVTVAHSGRSKIDVVALSGKMKEVVSRVRSQREQRNRTSDYAGYFQEEDVRSQHLVDKILSVRKTRKRGWGEHAQLYALHYTLLPVLKDVGVFSDFPEIHKFMQGKDRGKYGTRYRAICGENEDGASVRLLDLLENPKSCVSGNDIDIQKMKDNALRQCWKSCIMDLEDPKLQRGWQANQKCQGFFQFDDPNHPCSTWYKASASEEAKPKK